MDAADGHSHDVVLLDRQAARRDTVANSLRAAGFHVTAFATIADMERWPSGAVLVTDLAYFTPWWRTVGVRQLIVISGSAPAGTAVSTRGATTWEPRICSVEELILVLTRTCGAPSRARSGPFQGWA